MGYYIHPEFSTVGINQSKVWTEDIYLEKIIACQTFPRCPFEYNSSLVTEAIKDTLNWVVKILKDNPGFMLESDGYCSPNEKNAKALSLARANACRNYVISQGIDSARIQVKGWGAKWPLPGMSADDIAKMKTKEDKEQAYADDRRVEFRILRSDYQSIKK